MIDKLNIAGMIPRLATVIVNYNAGSLLSECVHSLLDSNLDNQIIVVDNASTDTSLEGLYELPHVTIIRNATNVGFASACNIGISATSAEFVFFLNPDGFVEATALSHLISSLGSDSSVGMVGGLLLNGDGSEQAGGRRAIPTPWISFVRAFGLHCFGYWWPNLFGDFHLHNQVLPNKPTEVEAISGACMLVKRSAIEDVGLWDEGYFLHCEDLDWCMRFRQKGWKILFVPTARIFHAQGACSKSRKVFVEWHKHKGMLRFYRKFFSNQYSFYMMGLVASGVWLRFGLVSLSLTLKQLISKFRAGHD